MSKEIVATIRKNKANDHKYVTIPRSHPLKEGQDVIIKERKESDSE